jgi:hypothetical protein
MCHKILFIFFNRLVIKTLSTFRLQKVDQKWLAGYSLQPLASSNQDLFLNRCERMTNQIQLSTSKKMKDECWVANLLFFFTA